MKRISCLRRLLLVSLLISLNISAAELPAKGQGAEKHDDPSLDLSLKSVDKFMDDSAITAKVKTVLVDDQHINSTDLSVSTNRGVVSVKGFVASYRQISKVKQLVASVKGVRQVNADLHIKPQQQTNLKSYASDTATTSEIVARLVTEKSISSRHVSVTTSHGVVLLTGKVSSREQKVHAGEIAAKVSGVREVKNQLSVGE
ncbi:BON domain-containing protein [Tatumella citrea]|uniref:BON domain-containing protein n=1 Tax=Tatumella citrea TaxID=53336 RepID=A0A1Y0LGU0_TATCI|nr:BON domain-containing protein [Tatumella citrea]ARU92936.1 hypothetical protein A7K98_03455 [Tatumella citrea]ARU96975.1 hypothetical protein A7K99_03455 [Tatumella citrea]